MENEVRLIDANEAVRLLRGKCVAKYPSSFLMGILASATEIEQSPTVDAVEVVRCKDCKRWDRFCDTYGACKTGQCFLHNTRMGEDDFCSYGERREGE